MKMGHCDWCNGIHVKCAECGSVTPVLESDYDQSMECEEGCGLKFRVLSKYEGNGLWEQHLEIIGNLKG